MDERFEFWEGITHKPPDVRPRHGEPRFSQRGFSGDQVYAQLLTRELVDIAQGNVPVGGMISRERKATVDAVGVWLRTDCSRLVVDSIRSLRLELIVASKAYAITPLWLLDCEACSVSMGHEEGPRRTFELDRALPTSIYVPQRQSVYLRLCGEARSLEPLRENEILLRDYYEIRGYVRGTLEER